MCIGARATIVSQSHVSSSTPAKHLLQIISREKNSRNKVRTGETLKNRILLLRERKRKNRKRATTIIVETFAGETFLSTRLLRTHISIFHSNPKPAPIQMDPGSRRNIRPPPLLDPPPSKRIRTRASNPSKRPRLSVPRHVHRLCSLLFSAKGACSRGWPRRRRRWRRCACVRVPSDVLERRAGRGSAYRCR